MANSVDPDQTAHMGAVCSASTLFASLLNSSVMQGNYLQQTTSTDNIFLGALRVKADERNRRQVVIYTLTLLTIGRCLHYTCKSMLRCTVLMLYVPKATIFSVVSGRSPVFLGWTSTTLRMKGLAQGHNTVSPVSLELATFQSQVWNSTNGVATRHVVYLLGL